MHPFNLIGVNIGRRHFDGGRKIEDDLPLGRGAPGLGNGVADFQCKVEFGGGEILRAVFEYPFGFRMLVGELFDERDRFYRHGDDFRLAQAKDDFAEGF